MSTGKPTKRRYSLPPVGLVTVLEWAGSLLGLTGAALLACNTAFSHYGWNFFLAANVAMLIFSYRIQRYGLFLQQLGFTVTSLLGIVRAGGTIG